MVPVLPAKLIPSRGVHLGGAAQDAARQLTPDELVVGGTFRGVMRGPVSYILAGLESRFGQMAEMVFSHEVLLCRGHKTSFSLVPARLVAMPPTPAVGTLFFRVLECFF